MTETIAAPTARNYVGGDWRESAGGETYEKHNPWRPSEVTGTYAASTADDAAAAIEAARAAFGGWARATGRTARRLLRQGRGRDRGARGAGRPGHDGGDGQAAPRGAHGDGARRSHPPLRGR